MSIASAVVEVTIEVKAASHWGVECTVAQVEKQATEGVLGYLRQHLDTDRVKILGTPKVRTIIHRKVY